MIPAGVEVARSGNAVITLLYNKSVSILSEVERMEKVSLSENRISNVKRIFFFVSSIFIGLIGRIYLITQLPIWLDEKSAVRWLQLPVSTLLFNRVVTDTAHPPGYYIFLKYWSILVHSTDTVPLRLSDIFFYLLNCFLFYQIGKRIHGKNFAVIIVFCYALSGYSVLFDWQLKQYSGLLTIILSTFLILLMPKKKYSSHLLFVLSYLGLIFDYGFLWYALPLFFYVVVSRGIPWLRKILDIPTSYFFALGVSFLLFSLTWLPHMDISAGFDAIQWVKYYSSPIFFIPYFLGAAHQNILFVMFLYALFIGSVIYLYKRPYQGLLLLSLISLSSLCCAYVVNIFVPVLHVRSLEIVGITIFLLYACCFHWCVEKKHVFLLGVLLVLYGVNFILILQTHFIAPEKLLLNFME